MHRAILAVPLWLAGASSVALAQVVPLPKPSGPVDQIPAPAGETVGRQQQANREMLTRKLAELDQRQAEIDRLRQATGTPSQVLVRLDLVELSLTKLKAIGLDATGVAPQGLPGANQFDPILSVSSNPMQAVEFGPEFNALLDLLCNEQIARRLAACSLIVASGSPAQFHQGLEAPQIKKENGGEWVEYSKLGMTGDVTALALGGDRVRVELRFRSPQDRQIGARLTPDQPTLEVNTHVETQLGQTVVAHAARFDRREVDKRVVPGLGEIPLIGNAFSRTRERKDEHLTLLLVTPEAAPVHGSTAPAAAAAVASDREQQRNQVLLHEKLNELNALRPEVERYRHVCRQGQQVILRLRMVEISRSRLKELQKERGAPHAALIERFLAAQPSGVIEDIEKFDRLLHDLGKGAATILAEPNLAAYVGRPANFNSGGEFPVIARQGVGATSVQYKKFGTEIGLMPIDVSNGRARLHLRFRCSEVDDATAVEFRDVSMPGLRVREVQTEVDAPLGQTTITYATPTEGVNKTEHRKGNRVRRSMKRDDLITLLLLTPEVLDAPAPPTQPMARAVPPAPAAPAVAAASGPPILFECRVLEIDVTKLRALGIDLAKLPDSPGRFGGVPPVPSGPEADPLTKLVGSNSPAARGFIEALEREGVATIVARPQLMTLAGQPAEVRVGRQVDVPDRDHPGKIGKGFVGTEIDVLPRVNSDGRIELKFKLGISEQGEPYGYKIDDKPVYFVSRMINESTLTLDDGQTMVAGGVHSGEIVRTKDHEKTRKAAAPDDGLPSNGVSRYILLTARIVRPSPAQEPTAQPATTARRTPPPPREAKVLPSPSGVAQPK